VHVEFVTFLKIVVIIAVLNVLGKVVPEVEQLIRDNSSRNMCELFCKHFRYTVIMLSRDHMIFNNLEI